MASVRTAGLSTAFAIAAALLGAPLRPQAPPEAPAKAFIHASEVPLYRVFAWERWGNFINTPQGSRTEIPYDAARLEVKVYPFASGEVRAIRFHDGVRTHRHINMTDTILYGWQAHRVQFVDNKAVVAGPGDFALHQKGVLHSGEEIRRGGGIDLEFALPFAGTHNDPKGYWSLARDNPLQPAANWVDGSNPREAIGSAADAAPPTATRYEVRTARLANYEAREVRLRKGANIVLRDGTRDRLLFLLSGRLAARTAGQAAVLVSESAASVSRGDDLELNAEEDSIFAEALVPPVREKR